MGWCFEVVLGLAHLHCVDLSYFKCVLVFYFAGRREVHRAPEESRQSADTERRRRGGQGPMSGRDQFLLPGLLPQHQRNQSHEGTDSTDPVLQVGN